MIHRVQVSKARPYKEAVKFVRKNRIKSQEHWIKFCKENKIPDDMPKSIETVYKKTGDWISFPDFFGTKNFKKVKWMKFSRARKLARSLKLKRQSDWFNHWKTNEKPKDLPYQPNWVYKKEWKSWGDWLDNGNISPLKKTFPNFEIAKKIVRSQIITSSKHFKRQRPKNKELQKIPSEPNSYYNEWIGWEDFLGSNYCMKQFMDYEEAKEIIQSLGIKTKQQFIDLIKQGKLPKGIPHSPHNVYRSKK